VTVEERGRLLVDAGLLGAGGARGAAPDEREAQWAGLVAAAAGVFIRSQYEAWAGVDRRASYRLVTRLAAAGLGEEANGGRGIGRYVQLSSRRIYKSLGMGDSRHRRKGSPGHLLQRLLALDFVIGRGEAGWLFGGKEQAAAFRALGAPEAVLPQRAYGPEGGDRKVVWFPAGWPVGLSNAAALFVFPDSGEAGQPQLELRTWGRHHARLWDWLRRSGVGVEAVFACRAEGRAQAVRKELQRWVDSGVPPRGGGGDGQDPGAEITRIDADLEAGRVKELVSQYGSLPAAVRKRKELLKSPGAQPRARVRAAGTWLSGRLQSRALAAGPALDAADFEVIPLSGGAARA